MDKSEYLEIYRKKDPDHQRTILIGSRSRGIFYTVTSAETIAENKEDDLVILNNIYEGFSRGWVPCKKCKPDIYTDRIVLNYSVSDFVRRVITMIEEGYLDNHTVFELAEYLHFSERYLRKIFSRETGITPSRLAMYHRGIKAKKLLSETDLPITDIIFISGFKSVRQFNCVMSGMFHATPTEIRARSSPRDDSRS